jgi:hypothetical protein
MSLRCKTSRCRCAARPLDVDALRDVAMCCRLSLSASRPIAQKAQNLAARRHRLHGAARDPDALSESSSRTAWSRCAGALMHCCSERDLASEQVHWGWVVRHAGLYVACRTCIGYAVHMQTGIRYANAGQSPIKFLI